MRRNPMANRVTATAISTIGTTYCVVTHESMHWPDWTYDIPENHNPTARMVTMPPPIIRPFPGRRGRGGSSWSVIGPPYIRIDDKSRIGTNDFKWVARSSRGVVARAGAVPSPKGPLQPQRSLNAGWGCALGSIADRGNRHEAQQGPRITKRGERVDTPLGRRTYPRVPRLLDPVPPQGRLCAHLLERHTDAAGLRASQRLPATIARMPPRAGGRTEGDRCHSARRLATWAL
jgi:hypothetical protein